MYILEDKVSGLTGIYKASSLQDIYNRLGRGWGRVKGRTITKKKYFFQPFFSTAKPTVIELEEESVVRP